MTVNWTDLHTKTLDLIEKRIYEWIDWFVILVVALLTWIFVL
jgi:hypothetical protein